MSSYKNYKKGPLRLNISRWSSNRQYFTVTAALLFGKVMVNASLSTAPSGIFIGGSLAGQTVTDYLNNYGKKKVTSDPAHAVVIDNVSMEPAIQAFKKAAVAIDKLSKNKSYPKYYKGQNGG